MSERQPEREVPRQWVRAEGWALGSLKVWVVLLLLVLLAGWVLMPVENRLWAYTRAAQPELQISELEGALGSGVMLGLFGGFRSVMADFMWLEVNQAWENRDPARVEAMLDLTTAVDPRPMFFWENGARMLGLDMPAWEIKAAGGAGALPQVALDRLNRFYAEKAFAFIDKGLSVHPDSSELMVDRARIYMVRLDDLESGAQWFVRAAYAEGALPVIPRTAATLLDRVGKTEEAVVFLKEQLAKTSEEDGIRYTLIESKLQSLEAKLRGEEVDEDAP